MKLRRHLPWSVAWCSLLILGACATDSPATKSRRHDHRKQFTGRNSSGQVEIQSQPYRSSTNPGFDVERIWGVEDDWEPALAVDPVRPFVYQLTTRYAWANPRIAFRRSSDGGATWDIDTTIPKTGNSQHDPQCAVARDGTVFVVWLDNWDTKLIRSSDHGVTWSSPVTVANPPPSSTDHAWLAISPKGKHVYVGFNWGHSYVSASHDFGQTFEDPVKTSNDNRQWFHSGAAVAPNGDVYIGAVDYRGSLRGRANINVLCSRDRGRTWTTTRVDTSAEPPSCGWSSGCYTGFFGPVTGLDVDEEGTILLAYNAGDLTGETHQLWVRNSTDGVNWSERQQISAPLTSSDNAFPAVAAGTRPGDFRVVWQADFSAVDGVWNTVYRGTMDGGERWGPMRVLSDLPGGAPYKGPDGYHFPYGDYLDLDVDGRGVLHAIWGEGDSWNGPGGTWSTRGQ